MFRAVFPKVKDLRYPRCCSGSRACPPEDCGGIGGYTDMLETISDPQHPEFERIMTWLGGAFDAEAFDPSGITFDSPKRRWRRAFGP